MKKVWKDPVGNIIPVDRVTPLERKKEKYAEKISKTALKVSEDLSSLKELIEKSSLEIYREVMEDRDVDLSKRKGNYTWYNFDKTIKVEIERSEKTDFDSFLIDACKTKLDSFLDTNVTTENQFIKQLILDAFQTTRGRLDTQRVMSLLKYRSKIEDKLFHSAMDDLENAITREFRKKYSRVWSKNQENGDWINIPLNYSDVEVVYDRNTKG
jgi:hypothetical protein